MNIRPVRSLTMARPVVLALCLCALPAVYAGAGPGPQGPVAAGPAEVITDPVMGDKLLPIPAPDLGVLEPAVRERLQTAQGEFVEALGRPDMPEAQRASAYGEIGRLYHAHHLYDPAEAAYRNARTLSPADYTWPYLLGYLYQESARFRDAAASYRRTLELRPGFAPAQLRLGQVYLGLDQPGQAEPLLRAALGAEGMEAAAAYELGKVAMARGRPEAAVEWFTRALDAQPQASRIHYPLAMAYRTLGDVGAARAQLRLRGDVEPEVADPIIQNLKALLGGARTHQYLAMKAVWNKQFDVAAREFASIVALEPDNLQARVSLARALYMQGDQERAREQLEQALQRDPKHARANYFMGRMLEEEGDEEAALAHYRTTLETDPNHAGAHFLLANALMREGDYAAAAKHYRRAVEILPDDLPARSMEAFALIAMGGHDGEARQRLEQALQGHPDDATLRQALARLLAASPDPEVRDPERALPLAKALFQDLNSIEHAEAVAMAYASLGKFGLALAYQQAAVDAAEQLAAYDIAEELTEELDSYAHQRPLRRPWRENARVFYPTGEE